MGRVFGSVMVAACLLSGCGIAEQAGQVEQPASQDANSLGAQSAADLACPGDANDTYAGVRIACVQKINAYRATQGLPAFGRWCGKAACIDGQTSIDGTQQTAHSAFGNCGESAQNECPDWPTPLESSFSQCLKQMWNEGPGDDFAKHGHYTNMTNTRYTMVECGLSVSGESFWGAMDFR